MGAGATALKRLKPGGKSAEQPLLDANVGSEGFAASPRGASDDFAASNDMAASGATTGTNETRMGRFKAKIRSLSPKRAPKSPPPMLESLHHQGSSETNDALENLGDTSMLEPPATPTTRMGRIKAKIRNLSPKRGNKAAMEPWMFTPPAAAQQQSMERSMSNLDETLPAPTTRFGRFKAKLRSLSPKGRRKKTPDNNAMIQDENLPSNQQNNFNDQSSNGSFPSRTSSDERWQKQVQEDLDRTRMPKGKGKGQKKSPQFSPMADSDSEDGSFGGRGPKMTTHPLFQEQIHDQDDRFSRPNMVRKRRTSASEGPDWMLPMVAEDPYENIFKHRLYFNPDPFKYLTNAWLNGEEGKPDDDRLEEEAEAAEHAAQALAEGVGEAETEEERVEREEREAETAERNIDRERESLRMKEQLNDKAGGWKLWLRGRDFRSEFRDQRIESASRNRTRDRENAEKTKAALPPRTVKNKGWIRAPIDAREINGDIVCWRTDFVAQARIDADILGLERPTIAAEKVRELARQDWGAIDLFYHYVEAVDLDGNRELWSPTFVGFLWEYWGRSQLGRHVKMTEDHLKEAVREERGVGIGGLGIEGLSGGLFKRKPVEWPKPIWKPPYVSIPGQVFHIVEQPELPPLPKRFQHHLVYKDGPLEAALADKFGGTECWDALLGIADRLQADGRSVLREEKFSTELNRRKEIAAKRRSGEAGDESATQASGLTHRSSQAGTEATGETGETGETGGTAGTGTGEDGSGSEADSQASEVVVKKKKKAKAKAKKKKAKKKKKEEEEEDE